MKRELKLHLQGLADYTEGEEYKLEFGDLPEEHNDNIMKWLAIDAKKNTLRSTHDELIYLVSF